MIDQAHERVRAIYGSEIGRKRIELVTPALILDLDVLRRNLDVMAELMKTMPAKGAIEKRLRLLLPHGLALGVEHRLQQKRRQAIRG